VKPKILIVDDEPSHRQMLEAVLSAEGYEVQQANDGQAAIVAVEERFYDLVIMDIRMSRVGGIEALKRIKEISPEIPVIIMTAYASVSTAVEALKSGAYDYLTKPIDIEELKILVDKVLRHHQLEQENLYLKERLKDRFNFANIIGSSAAMRKLFETVALVAPTEATVLVNGESGTGKELIANAIHQNSPRREMPFIKVNCAALPETLLESELFGHEKGAFTGAVISKQGRFHLAHTGSILLDEIGEMALTTQAKILRVLQEREFEPLGGSKTVKVDTRVIAATNKILEEEIREGRFREDLYYRLDVVTLRVPPLRERREDVPLLANFFLKRYTEKTSVLSKGLLPGLWICLCVTAGLEMSGNLKMWWNARSL
jgi:two-component system response regulator HydG